MSFILSLIRSLLTLIYRFILNEKLNFSSIEYIQIIGIISNTFIGYFNLIVFLLLYARELNLKFFLQK